MPNQPSILTFYDAIEHLRDWSGGAANIWNENAAYGAVRRALDDLVKAHKWTYYWRAGRINLEATYSTGTVEFDLTGGTYERMMTLTSGTWPTNAAYGWVRIDSVNYRVATRESATIITLESDSNPGADLSSGTSYEWFRSEYTLPTTFRQMTHPILVNAGMLWNTDVENVATMQRLCYATGQPSQYAILGDENVYGYHAILVRPVPTEAETADFQMLVWPRELKVAGIADADSSQAAGITMTTSGTTCTASAACFDSARHPGAIIRFGDATTIPTGYEGRNPPVEERKIKSVTSTTVAVLDQAPASAFSAVKFRIADPVDIDRGMVTAFLRGCELQMSMRTRDAKYINLATSIYKEALLEAIGSDARTTSYSVAGEGYDMGMGNAVVIPGVVEFN